MDRPPTKLIRATFSSSTALGGWLTQPTREQAEFININVDVDVDVDGPYQVRG